MPYPLHTNHASLRLFPVYKPGVFVGSDDVISCKPRFYATLIGRMQDIKAHDNYDGLDEVNEKWARLPSADKTLVWRDDDDIASSIDDVYVSGQAFKRSLKSKTVSRCHARITWESFGDGDQYRPVLFDEGSTHGTFVLEQQDLASLDGVHFTKAQTLVKGVPHYLRTGQIIVFGKRVVKDDKQCYLPSAFRVFVNKGTTMQTEQTEQVDKAPKEPTYINLADDESHDSDANAKEVMENVADDDDDNADNRESLKEMAAHITHARRSGACDGSDEVNRLIDDELNQSWPKNDWNTFENAGDEVPSESLFNDDDDDESLQQEGSFGRYDGVVGANDLSDVSDSDSESSDMDVVDESDDDNDDDCAVRNEESGSFSGDDEHCASETDAAPVEHTDASKIIEDIHASTQEPETALPEPLQDTLADSPEHIAQTSLPRHWGSGTAFSLFKDFWKGASLCTSRDQSEQADPSRVGAIADDGKEAAADAEAKADAAEVDGSESSGSDETGDDETLSLHDQSSICTNSPCKGKKRAFDDVEADSQVDEERAALTTDASMLTLKEPTAPPAKRSRKSIFGAGVAAGVVAGVVGTIVGLGSMALSDSDLML